MPKASTGTFCSWCNRKRSEEVCLFLCLLFSNFVQSFEQTFFSNQKGRVSQSHQLTVKKGSTVKKLCNSVSDAGVLMVMSKKNLSGAMNS